MGNPRVLRPVSRRLKAPGAEVDRAGMARAVADFLGAAGLDLTDEHLRDTPARVAEAFAAEFLDGYRTTPEEALGELYPVKRQGKAKGGLVVVTGLRFRSVCPHHLLPYAGRAHLAYVPSQHVVGFGRLSALLDCFAHRLVLQETLAEQVAQALARCLKSPATACILEAEQACLRLRGDEQWDAVTHAEAYAGKLRTDPRLRRELWARVPRALGRAKTKAR